MWLLLSEDFLAYFGSLLFLSGLQKCPLCKNIFKWMIMQTSAFLEGQKNVKDSNSYLQPHFPKSMKPSILIKLQHSTKRMSQRLKFRVDEMWAIKASPSTYGTIILSAMMFTAMKFFQAGICDEITASFCVCFVAAFFFSLMILFSPNNCLFGTIDSVSHCHGFAGRASVLISCFYLWFLGDLLHLSKC